MTIPPKQPDWIEQNAHARARKWSLLLNFLVLLITALVFLGWRADVDYLTRFVPRFGAMVPAAPVCFVLVAFGQLS